MKKNLFIQHYDSLLETFYFYFHKVEEGGDMEDIHQLRVSIKKLRAIWSLADIMLNGKWKKKKHQKLFKKLFDNAGMIREAQINLGLIAQMDDSELAEYSAHLKKLEDKGLIKLLNQIDRFDTSKLDSLNRELFKHLSKTSEEKILKHTESYISLRFKKIEKLLSKPLTNKQLHKIRILLKGIHELFTIIQELDLQNDLSELLEEIKTLNHEIGIWHDYTVLNTSLEKFHQTPSEKVKTVIKDISSEQINRATELIQSIENHVKQFV